MSTGRRRSKSFYGKEGPQLEKPGIERKSTAVDLNKIVLQATLKENIQKEIEKLKAQGEFEVPTSIDFLAVFEEHATTVLTQPKDEVKKYKYVIQIVKLSHFFFRQIRLIAQQTHTEKPSPARLY